MTVIAIHHRTRGMFVVDEIHKEQLLSSGDWFLHPNDIPKEESKNEQPIRRKQKQRSSDGKKSSKQISVGTQCE